MDPSRVEENSFLLMKGCDGNFSRVQVKGIKDEKARVMLIDVGRTIVRFLKFDQFE
jgi:Tudor domain